MPFIERNVTSFAVAALVIGGFIAFIMPYILSKFIVFGLAAPNEVGDAMGGISNPIVTFIGVFLTFLAFYIQYKANERQTFELEKQKANSEYKYLQQSVQSVKDDLRSLTYTKDRVTYRYSEAIWYFMHDSFEQTIKEEALMGPLYFQMSYVLTQFEPLIDEVADSNLSVKEKYQMLLNLQGLFESSLAFILKVNEKAIIEGKEKYMGGLIKTKIIIPAKKIKIVLKDALDRFKESEKDLFYRALSKTKAAAFVRQARVVGGRATVHFFKNYAEYLATSPKNLIDVETYDSYFDKEEDIIKLLMNEPVRLMVKLEFLEKITFNIPTEAKSYKVDLGRETIEEYFDLDLTELKIDKNLWRDAFLGKFVYQKKERDRFQERFVKTTKS